MLSIAGALLSFFTAPLRLVSVKTLGLVTAVRVSETCMFATFMTPVNRDFRSSCLW